jgi:ribosomal protein S12 methylthiotransferase accessory factor
MTSILGKAKPVEESIAAMTSLLTQQGFELEEIEWRNPLPNAWFVRLQDKERPFLYSQGKGRTELAARASALGGFIERLSCNYFFAPFYLGEEIAKADFVHYPNEKWFPTDQDALPDGLLDEATISHYNMDEALVASMLVDVNSSNRERGICALPFHHQKTENTVWFPVNLIRNLYACSGMSAGNNRYEARVQALSEIFERHIKNTILSSGITLPQVPGEELAQYPSIQTSLDALKEKGFIVYVLDASLGGKFPLVNVSVFNPKNGGCIACFGAHPKFEIALERAVIELFQGRDWSDLESLEGPVFDLQLVADQANIEQHLLDSSGLVSWELFSNEPDYPFVKWNIEGDAQAEFEHLCYLIHKVDMDIYIADFDHLGMYACRIIVPGMSEIYPVETLVFDNNNILIDHVVTFRDLSSATEQQLNGLMQAIHKAPVDRGVNLAWLFGVLPDEGGYFETFSVSEFFCLVHLVFERYEEALQECDWLLENASPEGSRYTLYRLLKQLLELSLYADVEFDEIRHVLNDVYGAKTVSLGLDKLQGQGVFDDCPVIQADLGNLKDHSALIALYKQLHQLKIKAMA